MKKIAADRNYRMLKEGAVWLAPFIYQLSIPTGGALGTLLTTWKYRDNLKDALKSNKPDALFINNLSEILTYVSEEDAEFILMKINNWVGNNTWRMGEFRRFINTKGLTTAGEMEELKSRYLISDEAGDLYFQHLLGHGEDESQKNIWSPRRELQTGISNTINTSFPTR